MKGKLSQEELEVRRAKRIERHNAFLEAKELAERRAKRQRAIVRPLREAFVKDQFSFDGEIFPAYVEAGEWTSETKVFFDRATIKRIKDLLRAYGIGLGPRQGISYRRINGATLYTVTVSKWVQPAAEEIKKWRASLADREPQRSSDPPKRRKAEPVIEESPKELSDEEWSRTRAAIAAMKLAVQAAGSWTTELPNSNPNA